MFGLGVPLYIALIFFKLGTQVQWKPLLVGVAAMVPTSIISAGLLSLFFPVRLSPDGIHAQSVWGLPRFIRWQDIKQARRFSFFNLRWLRLHSRADNSVTWVALFQTPAVAFNQEIHKLAPPDSPVLAFFP